MFIKTFNEILKGDTAEAGGKGASLGEMTQAKIPVPRGFVLLANAFERFLEKTNLNTEIDSISDSVNQKEMHTVEAASEKIKALIAQTNIPQDIEREIKAAFMRLKAPYVAVRSSATIEDSTSAAWAGQLETYLNTTEKSLSENIKKCWSSLYTPRAIFYRFENNLEKQKISVAVVVQVMVQSDTSGIAFSVHPVTEDRNQLLIEAGYGLGEAIVSGQITPDSYVVKKQELTVFDKKPSDQTKALVRSKAENKWVVVPRSKANKQKLSDREIIDLSKLVINIEKHYGFPVDVEWAREKSEFYIVQSRPITTLSASTMPSHQTNLQKYEKLFSRDFSLPSVEAWVRGESTNPKEWTEEKQPYLPYIVTERSDDTVHFYYNLQGVEWVQDLLVKLAHENKSFLTRIETTVKKKLKFIRPIYEKEKTLNLLQLKRFVKELEGGYPWFEAMWWFCQMDEAKLVGLDLKNMQKVRALTDILCNSSDTVIRKSLAKLYPHLGDLSSVLHTEEILSGKLPTKTELERRYKGYFFGNGQLFTGINKSRLAKKLGINFVDEVFEKSDQLKGEVAQKGIVRGHVRRVMGHKQITRIKEGEILVSPMTIPDFLPAIKKAAAIVTDEGGVVCHAAIVARELKKPCIVGTKFATQTFKDGDFVEVDANKGVVSLIK